MRLAVGPRNFRETGGPAFQQEQQYGVCPNRRLQTCFIRERLGGRAQGIRQAFRQMGYERRPHITKELERSCHTAIFLQNIAQTLTHIMHRHKDDRVDSADENAMKATLSILATLVTGAAVASAQAPTSGNPIVLAASKGVYRLPYQNGTRVKVFDDFETHRPVGRIDFFAVGGAAPYRVVAAAAGRVVAIQDSFAERQSGRAAKDCHNNYVWIAHPNGEWTNYSHLAHGSVTGTARLRVGSTVKTGQFLGYEGSVGCAILDHLHFEVAVPATKMAVDEGGFLIDNDQSMRERKPRFCRVGGAGVKKDETYLARDCR
jgi:Peptidase family M23